MLHKQLLESVLSPVTQSIDTLVINAYRDGYNFGKSFAYNSSTMALPFVKAMDLIKAAFDSSVAHTMTQRIIFVLKAVVSTILGLVKAALQLPMALVGAVVGAFARIESVASIVEHEGRQLPYNYLTTTLADKLYSGNDQRDMSQSDSAVSVTRNGIANFFSVPSDESPRSRASSSDSELDREELNVESVTSKGFDK